MKTRYLLFTLLMLLAPLGLRAQTSDSLRTKLAQVFAPLDKSQVPTGRLAEDALPLSACNMEQR